MPILIAALIVVGVFVLGIFGFIAYKYITASENVLASTEFSQSLESNVKEKTEDSYDSAKKSGSNSSFTNLFGTPTTICAHSGCTNYIASSGDTNCCTTHSNHCLGCNKYIDGDAAFCMICVANALKNSSSSSFTNLYGTPTTICAHSGCTNYIASSGDTNCCTTHSNHCLGCNKYIDGDAMFCMTCVANALTK